jgi:hypothetical protein
MSRVHTKGDLRADKIQYPDGVGCCIWYPLAGTEDAGICFDFHADDIPDMIKLLQTLQDAEPDVFKDDEESAAVVEGLKDDQDKK